MDAYEGDPCGEEHNKAMVYGAMQDSETPICGTVPSIAAEHAFASDDLGEAPRCSSPRSSASPHAPGSVSQSCYAHDGLLSLVGSEVKCEMKAEMPSDKERAPTSASVGIVLAESASPDVFGSAPNGHANGKDAAEGGQPYRGGSQQDFQQQPPYLRHLLGTTLRAPPKKLKAFSEALLTKYLGTPLSTTGLEASSLTRYVELHDALDLLQLQLEEVELPLGDLPALLPDVPEEAPTHSAGARAIELKETTQACQRATADACAPLRVSPPEAQEVAFSPDSAWVGQQDERQQDDEEHARRKVLYAAKRFQRQRRLFVQQVRNRLHAALQQISELHEAKGAVEVFLAELRQEMAATRAAREKVRNAKAGKVSQVQGSRVYFDTMPPPSTEQLTRRQKQQEPRSVQEDEASDVADCLSGVAVYEGSACVEHLMQRYYTTLIADVDQAAKEHFRAPPNGGSNAVEPSGGHDAAPDVSWGAAVAPYYFDPFSPDQGTDVSRRREQGGGPSRPPSAAAPSAAAGGSGGAISGQSAAAFAARSHPMLSAAAEKVKGVAFCKSNRYWICTRMEHGKQQCRYFSVKHLGFECARREAILLRQQWKGDVNEEVLRALEEEKAAMEAAGVPGGSVVPIRARGTGDMQSPSLRPAAPPTPPVASPSKVPHGAARDGPAPRKEKSGPVKRRRDTLTRPLLIDRSGTMPRPPPEFDFASDSDFLTENEEDREEEALAMNAAVLAEFSDRNARANQGMDDEAFKNDPESVLKRRRREIIANCFMGVTSTADALVLLSRRLTYAVKIPGISFHKGVESWLCTWKEPDSRTISRYFRCSRFGFRRGFKLSVYTLLLNAPRAAGMRAFMAIKEIKRRRRAALRGDLYSSPSGHAVERPLSADASDSLDRGLSLSSTVEAQHAAGISGDASGTLPVNSASLCTDPEVLAAQHAATLLAQQNGTVDGVGPPLNSLGFPTAQLVGLGGEITSGGGMEVADQVASAAAADPTVAGEIRKPPHNAEMPVAGGEFNMLTPDPGATAVPGAAPVGADALKCDASTRIATSPRAEGNPHETLSGHRLVAAHFGAA